MNNHVLDCIEHEDVLFRVSPSLLTPHNKSHFLEIFYDINQAYDTVRKHKIISTLHSWNIRGNVLYFIRNFLKNREFVVQIRGTISYYHTLTNGDPQGAVLSPIIFDISTNGLPTCIPAFVSEVLFVNDLCTFIECKDPTIEGQLLQETANNIHKQTYKMALKCLLQNQQQCISAKNIRAQKSFLFIQILTLFHYLTLLDT